MLARQLAKLNTELATLEFMHLKFKYKQNPNRTKLDENEFQREVLALVSTTGN